jgi:hypothetical protein
MIEILGITIIDRRSKGRPRKMENQTIEKIGCVAPILIKNIEGNRKSDIARPHKTLP